MLTNFHTHNELCRHACGNVFDYVLKAIKENYDELGISDHAPLNKYYFDRMQLNELDGYLRDINTCKKLYKESIKIYSGLETEYFKDQIDEIKALRAKTDYLILAPHDFIYKEKQYCSFFIKNDEELKGYFETLISGIESRLYQFAAHPDLFAFSYKMNKQAEALTHQLGEVCRKNDFILEFNANGFRRGKSNILGENRYPYPYQPFWDIIKEYKVKVIVNSDCHDPNLLNDEYDKYAKEVAYNWNLSVVDTIF